MIVRGVEEARKAVRQAFYDGADCIKVIVNTGARVLSLEEMKVIVEEAHRVNRKVAAHAIGDLATRISAEAGVDSIEHAYTIPDDVLQMMARKKIYLVPTDYPAEFYSDAFPPPAGATPQQIIGQKLGAKQFADSNQKRLERAIKAGVRIAAGSDEYYQIPGKTRGQSSLLMFRSYALSGMTPLDIIRARRSRTPTSSRASAGNRRYRERQIRRSDSGPGRPAQGHHRAGESKFCNERRGGD